MGFWAIIRTRLRTDICVPPKTAIRLLNTDVGSCF